jgi:hypothetical protein
VSGPRAVAGPRAVVDAHVAALAAALPRRGRWSRVLVAEARDGLVDAAAAYRDAGLGAVDAERRAVADFGPVEAVAPAYRQEVAVRQARRTSRLLCGLLVPPLLAWPAVLAADRPPHGVAVLAGHLAGVAGLAVLVAAVTLAWTARATPGRRLPLVVGTAAVAGGTAVAAALAGVAAHLPLTDPAPAALTAATALATGGVAWSGLLCRRTA